MTEFPNIDLSGTNIWAETMKTEFPRKPLYTQRLGRGVLVDIESDGRISLFMNLEQNFLLNRRN